MELFDHDGIEIAYDVRGNGPPLLLLHGFPQTRALWQEVADRLSDRFTLIMPDLRGYGDSSKPRPSTDLSNYSFRAMGEDLLALMAHLGHGRFCLAGHDRGGRVGYRMALDAPERIARLCVMDIVPTLHLAENWSMDVARDYYHWTFLSQPAPFAEKMIAADPDHFYEACLLGWGGAQLSDFAQIEAYRRAWRDPAAIISTTADYRAALEVDAPMDARDRKRTVDCPTLVLWGRDGAMARRFDVAATWEPCLSKMRASPMPGGHFFIDAFPAETAEMLADFMTR